MARKAIHSLGVGDDFEGRQITKQTMALTNAGDGLSRAMKVAAETHKPGDKVFVLMETTVGKITFDPFDDTLCARNETLKAEVATIVDEAFAKETIDKQRAAEKAHEDEQSGQGDFLKLAEDHDAGLHDTPNEQCPKCANSNVTPIGGKDSTKDKPARAPRRSRGAKATDSPASE